MPVMWTEDLATGVGLIDDQHKELFRRIDALLEACKRGEGKPEVVKTLDFLEEYVVTHFTDEEKLQRDSLYPAYRGHKAIHDKFILDVKGLRKKFEVEGPSLSMVMTTNKVVVDWLVNHIKKVDKLLGAYIKGRDA